MKMFYITFYFRIKSVVMFMNAPDMCQIICRNVQPLNDVGESGAGCQFLFRFLEKNGCKVLKH